MSCINGFKPDGIGSILIYRLGSECLVELELECDGIEINSVANTNSLMWISHA